LTEDKLKSKSDLPFIERYTIENILIIKPSIQMIIKINDGFGITLAEYIKRHILKS